MHEWWVHLSLFYTYFISTLTALKLFKLLINTKLFVYIITVCVWFYLQIIGGSYHVLALTKDGKLYSWGHNEYGQLGIGTTTCSTVPVQVGNHLGRSIGAQSHF